MRFPQVGNVRGGEVARCGRSASGPDWEGAAQGLLAGFRRSVGSDADDPLVVELVLELTAASAGFKAMWARHDIGPRAGAALTLNHPQVGTIKLDREKLSINGTDGIMLVIYHPQPDTDSGEKLAFLASFNAPAAVSPRNQ